MKPFRAATWSDAGSSDCALVQQCATGDEVACAQLVTDHQRMVYQLALHLLGDPQEAMDLSQEVFLRVFRTTAQFRGQSSLRTWIYRIVVNQASNRQRSWRRRFRAYQVTLDDHAASHGELAAQDRSASPEQVLQQHETAGRVWQALASLPFEQRVAIVLREIDGLGYDEIAESLGVVVGTVKSRLARARLNLRDALRDPAPASGRAR